MNTDNKLGGRVYCHKCKEWTNNIALHKCKSVVIKQGPICPNGHTEGFNCIGDLIVNCVVCGVKPIFTNQEPSPMVDTLCEARGEPLSGLIWANDARKIEFKLDQVKKERDAAIAELSKASQAAGRAEGKLIASETYGVLEGWRKRALEAEAERDSALVHREQELDTLRRSFEAEIEQIRKDHADKLHINWQALKALEAERDATNATLLEWQTHGPETNRLLNEQLDAARRERDEAIATAGRKDAAFCGLLHERDAARVDAETWKGTVSDRSIEHAAKVRELEAVIEETRATASRICSNHDSRLGELLSERDAALAKLAEQERWYQILAAKIDNLHTALVVLAANDQAK